MQKKNYFEVAPHNHRIKSKTHNKNIDWSLTKYDILRRHPVNFRKLMVRHWGTYALSHDIKRIKSGHPNDTYGDRSPQKNNQILKAVKGKRQKIWEIKPLHLEKEILNSVRGMFQRKNKLGYRTIETGFARGTNHKNQIGSDRQQIWKQIKKAYPHLNNADILRSEAKGLDHVPHKMNQLMPGFRITDYDVHVDEKKKHFGQAHLQGRIALLGQTKTGKPSFNLNNSIQESVAPHKALLKQLDKIYYPEDYGTKQDHMNFHNNVGRFHAFNMLASYITFKTEAQQLERDFPQAKLNFHLIRTYSPSVSHDEYIRQQDQGHVFNSSVNRVTKKTKQHLQKSYASSQANWLTKQCDRLSQSSAIISASASTITRHAKFEQSSVNRAGQDLTKAQAEVHRRNINLLTRFMAITQANNPDASNTNHTLNDFAEDCYWHGFNYGGKIHIGDGLVNDQQTEAIMILNQRDKDINNQEANNCSNADSVSSAAASVTNARDSLNSSYHSLQDRSINRLSSLLGSSEVTEHGMTIPTELLYKSGMAINNQGSLFSQSDLVSYLIKQRRKKYQRSLDRKQQKLDRDKESIRKARETRQARLKRQFSLIVPTSYQVKNESRVRMINQMAQGVKFKGAQLGDNKFHQGLDLELRFINYDIQHGIDDRVKDVQNEINDYQRNEPNMPHNNEF